MQIAYKDQLDEILNTHHEDERELIKQIADELAEAVAEYADSQMVSLLDDFNKMTAELLNHFRKEEQVVFPLMYIHDTYDAETMEYIETLMQEHQEQKKWNQRIAEQLSVLGRRNHTILQERIEDLLSDIEEHISKEDQGAFTNYITQFSH